MDWNDKSRNIPQRVLRQRLYVNELIMRSFINPNILIVISMIIPSIWLYVSSCCNETKNEIIVDMRPKMQIRTDFDLQFLKSRSINNALQLIHDENKFNIYINSIKDSDVVVINPGYQNYSILIFDKRRGIEGGSYFIKKDGLFKVELLKLKIIDPSSPLTQE